MSVASTVLLRMEVHNGGQEFLAELSLCSAILEHQSLAERCC